MERGTEVIQKGKMDGTLLAAFGSSWYRGRTKSTNGWQLAAFGYPNL